jgi:hypothetical protein
MATATACGNKSNLIISVAVEEISSASNARATLGRETVSIT